MIFELEDEEFYKCFPELKKELRKHLAKYPNVENWCPGEYPKDKVVKYDGVLLRAKKKTDREPNCEIDWCPVDKFTKDCYNKIWCYHGLRNYIALKITLCVIGDVAVAITGNGAIVKRGQDFIAANKDLLGIKIGSLRQKAKMSINRVQRFLESCEDESCFGFINRSCGCEDTPCSCPKPNTCSWSIS